MQTRARILVTGGDGIIGAAIVRALRRRGSAEVLDSAAEGLDLTDAAAVESAFARHRPEYVFHAGGKTAGIVGNQRHPADLMLDNLLGATHVLRAAWRHKAAKLLYLASSCSYPRLCPQPMKEEYLLTGPLEPTNEAYAVAKLAGLKLAQALRAQYGAPFIVAVAPNVFGPGDDFHPEDSHVIGALLRRFHEARRAGAPSVTVWGSGKPRREFMFVDDLAEAALFAMEHYDLPEPINLGGAEAVSIAELAEAVRQVTGFPGTIVYDAGKPDGMPVKILDSTKLKALGWRPQTALRPALEATYAWYREHVAGGAGR